MNSGRSPCGALLTALLAVSLSWCAGAAVAQGEFPYSVPHAQGAPTQPIPALPARAGKLVTMLQLTTAQQAELAKILASQRERIRNLWSDAALEPGYRVSAMRAINEQTEERIRGLLTEEQKKKYMTPRSTSPAPSSRSDAVEHWFDAPPQK